MPKLIRFIRIGFCVLAVYQLIWLLPLIGYIGKFDLVADNDVAGLFFASIIKIVFLAFCLFVFFSLKRFDPKNNFKNDLFLSIKIIVYAIIVVFTASFLFVKYQEYSHKGIDSGADQIVNPQPSTRLERRGADFEPTYKTPINGAYNARREGEIDRFLRDAPEQEKSAPPIIPIFESMEIEANVRFVNNKTLYVQIINNSPNWHVTNVTVKIRDSYKHLQYLKGDSLVPPKIKSYLFDTNIPPNSTGEANLSVEWKTPGGAMFDVAFYGYPVF